MFRGTVHRASPVLGPNMEHTQDCVHDGVGNYSNNDGCVFEFGGLATVVREVGGPAHTHAQQGACKLVGVHGLEPCTGLFILDFYL